MCHHKLEALSLPFLAVSRALKGTILTFLEQGSSSLGVRAIWTRLPSRL